MMDNMIKLFKISKNAEIIKDPDRRVGILCGREQ